MLFLIQVKIVDFIKINFTGEYERLNKEIFS